MLLDHSFNLINCHKQLNVDLVFDALVVFPIHNCYIFILHDLVEFYIGAWSLSDSLSF